MIHSQTRNWNAYWIWPERESESKKNVYYYFRCEFSLNETPATEYSLYITADTRYEIYINDQKIGYGPPQSVPYYQYYDRYMVDSQLRSGSNCIAVIVNQTGIEPGAQGGLLLELTAEDGTTVIASDERFTCLHAGAWRQNTFQFRMSMYTPFQEMYDAQKEPEGWKKAGFVDADWTKVRRLAGLRHDRPPAVTPWTYLVARDIPYMIETKQCATTIVCLEESIDLMNRMRGEDLSIGLSTTGEPLQYTVVSQPECLLREDGGTMVSCSTNHMDHEFDGVYNPSIVLDFGRSVNAFFELELTGPAGGAVDIGYAERLINGHFHNAIEGQFADRYTFKEGRQRYRPFTWKSFRYVKLLFRGCFDPVTIHAAQASVTAYPFVERGSFLSNDIRLNRLFDICRNTIHLCSNECIMDTPWREQAQFTGDAAAVTLGGIYSCYGDTALASKFIRQSAANQLPTGFLTNVTNSLAVASNADWRTIHPDYSLWWVYGLWNHYMYTGDESWIHDYYPHVLKIAQAFLQYQGDSGLIENMPYALFIDWSNIDRRGISAPLNAIAYETIGLAERMATLKGDAYTEQWLRSRRATIREQFANQLYDRERGVIADAQIDGTLSELVSEQANMSAILFGLLEQDMSIDIIHKLYEMKSIPFTESQPFFTKFALQALTKLERADLALEIISERWGKRMVDRGASSTYEEWGLNGSWRTGEYLPIMRTQSHAWSAYPAEYLICGLCRLEIVEPGCRTLRIHPLQVELEYEAEYPTPLGNVLIRRSKGQFMATGPAGIKII